MRYNKVTYKQLNSTRLRINIQNENVIYIYILFN